MATITTPYGCFFTDVANGVHHFAVASAYKIALIKDTYTPNIDTDTQYNNAAIQGNELATQTGYAAGGATLTGTSWTYDATNDWSILAASSITWTGITGSIRYAVVYYAAGSTQLVGVIDFGTTRTYNAEDFQLAFPNGVVRLRKAS